MRTTISLPDPLLENAKERASQRGITLSELIEDAVREHIAGKPEPPEPPFQLLTFSGELVNPDIDLDRTSALIVAEDEEIYGKALKPR
jgi:hypothetical protein